MKPTLWLLALLTLCLCFAGCDRSGAREQVRRYQALSPKDKAIRDRADAAEWADVVQARRAGSGDSMTGPGSR